MFGFRVNWDLQKEEERKDNVEVSKYSQTYQLLRSGIPHPRGVASLHAVGVKSSLFTLLFCTLLSSAPIGKDGEWFFFGTDVPG